MSYDGGDVSHLETATPCLDALGLRATFYAPPTRILDSPTRWRELALAGHEIGDASLFDAASPDGFLHDWSAEMVERDLAMAESFHVELFGSRARHSFAYPVRRTQEPADDDRLDIRAMQQTAMVRPVVRKYFDVARASTDGYNDPASCDALALRCVRAMDCNADELALLARRAVDAGAWVIFAFDGVGIGDPAIDAVEHAKFCLWLAERRSKILVGTVQEIGSRIAKVSRAVVRRGEPEDVAVEVAPTL